jgi:hypothetical protein
MSQEDLLRFANDKKPADFAAEFKTQVAAVVAQKLTSPKQVVEVKDDESGE